MFHEARVFCKKVLIESEKRLDFIGALICNIKVRLNSATNFVIPMHIINPFILKDKEDYCLEKGVARKLKPWVDI